MSVSSGDGERKEKSIAAMRERGAEALASWRRQNEHRLEGNIGWTDRRARFESEGFVLVRGFATSEECNRMIGRMGELVDRWDPAATLPAVFSTKTDQTSAQGSSDYFLDSADRVHFFVEKGTCDGDKGTLLPGFAKTAVLNKVGHGLHLVDDVFRSYSTSEKIRGLVRELGWKDPVLPQSMYIFKQPRIGGVVTSHQDSCFLHTEPRQTCLGLWLALHDATLQNGCLWARPGSHLEPLRRRFSRNPAHFEGNRDAPQMVFHSLDGSRAPWEGALPANSWPPPSDGLFDAGFVPLECKAGDLLVFPGLLDHLSLANYSETPRHTFQLHLVEGPEQGVEWSETNCKCEWKWKCSPSISNCGVAVSSWDKVHDPLNQLLK